MRPYQRPAEYVALRSIPVLRGLVAIDIDDDTASSCRSLMGVRYLVPEWRALPENAPAEFDALLRSHAQVPRFRQGLLL